MDNIVELNNAKTNNEYSTENFTIIYNELKKLELYDFNKLDNRISENTHTSDTTIIDHIYTLMVLIFVMYEPVNYLISISKYNFTYIPT